MRLFLTTILISFLSISAYSQFWITSVSTSPSPANDCDVITISINGNLSSSNCSYVSSNNISGTTITIDVNVTCGGIGLPTITPYTESIILGTIPSNNYTLIVHQYSSGILQETNSSILNIGTCCSSVASVNPLNSTVCIGDSTSLLNVGTIADSLVWSDNGIVFTPNTNSLGWSYMFSTLGIHNVTLTAYDSTGCTNSTNVTITINDLPEILITSLPATCATCQDGQALVTVLSGSPPYQLLWNNGSNLNPLTGLNPGNYIASCTDGNLCSVTDSVLVGNSVNVNEFKVDDFLVYPNPSYGKIHLNILNTEFNNINLKVFNLSGELIEEKVFFGKLNRSHIVDLDLSRGIYLLKVNNFSRRIVIK